MRVYEEMICGTARLQCYICGESPEMPNYVREAMLVYILKNLGLF